jgi:septum formation protein
VTFRALAAHELEAYVSSGEWHGRSGGYAIQKGGARLASAIDGPEDNVVGLPLATVRALFGELWEGR